MASASATTSSESLASRFGALRASGRRALVCYITAGHPDPDRSLALMRGLEAAGADVVELGVPFSDPMADGPVIQGSSQQALEHGVTFDRVLALAQQARLAIPVVLFSYLNPLLAAGPDALSRAAAAGCRGILVTDLPLGADAERESWLGNGPLDFIRLVAPTTPKARMAEIAKNGKGFVYLISRMGVTGESAGIDPALPGTIATLRSVTDLPVCVGFGISTPQQAAEVGGLADGVVVGSALVRAAGESVAKALVLVESMRRALDEGAYS